MLNYKPPVNPPKPVQSPRADRIGGKQEPFGYFKPEPFGWTDCAQDDEGAVALYEHPAPTDVAELVSAASEVLRISDRKHDAWDRLRAALAKHGVA